MPIEPPATVERRPRQRPVTVEEARQARSEAEQRLFAALEADRRTTGCFKLNATIDVAFGGRRTEIDLMCGQSRLAVEVDGYHHFRDADGYRRDRRKDVLLQLHGWVVFRVLAEDVHHDTPGVVDAIAGTIHSLLKGHATRS
jgi:very-short-patch-repair endonuclease